MGHYRPVRLRLRRISGAVRHAPGIGIGQQLMTEPNPGSDPSGSNPPPAVVTPTAAGYGTLGAWPAAPLPQSPPIPAPPPFPVSPTTPSPDHGYQAPSTLAYPLSSDAP